MFDNGVASYVEATATVKVFFPVDKNGVAYVNCSNCYFHSDSGNRCRLNGEIASYAPNKYIGGSCPLNFGNEEVNEDAEKE